MNFFEEELRKIFGKNNIFKDITYTGRYCLGIIDKDIRAKIQFVTLGIQDKYDALKIDIINRVEGNVDFVYIRMRDLLGKKAVSNPNFKEGIVPHIWEHSGEASWYVYKPNEADYKKIYKKIEEYIEVFKNEEVEEEIQSPQMF